MRVPNNLFTMPATTYQELLDEFGGGPFVTFRQVNQRAFHRLNDRHCDLPEFFVPVPWEKVSSRTMAGTVWYGVRFRLRDDQTAICSIEVIYRVFSSSAEAVYFKMTL